MLKSSYCKKNSIVTIKMDINTYNDFTYEIENYENESLDLCFSVLDRCQDAINDSAVLYQPHQAPYLAEAFDPLAEIDEPDEPPPPYLGEIKETEFLVELSECPPEEEIDPPSLREFREAFIDRCTTSTTDRR